MKPALEPFFQRHGAWILVILTVLLLLPGTGALPLMDRDEPRFATATREMLDRGDFVIPWFNGGYRFDKPPLIYWMMMPGYALAGDSEGTARLPAVFATILAVLGIFGFGRQLGSARSGFLAGVGFLTCLQVQIHGRLALADPPMIAALVFAQWAGWNLIRPREDGGQPEGHWFWVLWLSLSLGFLAKGPIGPLVFLLTLVIYRITLRRPVPWRRLRPLGGLVVFILPVAAWGIPALVLTGGAFWDVGMGHHVIDRGMDAFNDRLTLPFFYCLTVFLSLFPWFAFFWVALRRLRRPWTPEGRFLMAWFAAPFLIFSFYATQLPHYVLPGFPAFFLLLFRRPGLPVARGVRTWWERVYAGLAVLAVAALLLIASILVFAAPEARAVGFGVLALAAMAGCLWFASDGVARGRLPRAGAAVLGLVVFTTAFAHCLREAHLIVRLEATLREAGFERGEREVVATAFTEPGLVFYGRTQFDFRGEAAELPLALEAGDPRMVIVLRREFRGDETFNRFVAKLLGRSERILPTRTDEVPAGVLDPAGWEVRTVAGFNPARSSWVEVDVYTAR